MSCRRLSSQAAWMASLISGRCSISAIFFLSASEKSGAFSGLLVVFGGWQPSGPERRQGCRQVPERKALRKILKRSALSDSLTFELGENGPDETQQNGI